MLNRNNLRIAKLTAKDGTKYAINGVLVTPTETVATDGHILVAVATDPQTAEEIPSAIRSEADFAPFICPRDTAIEAEKTIPKNHPVPLLKHAFVRRTEDGAELVATDMETDRTIRVQTIAGTYPNWRQCFPSTEPAATFTVDAVLLLNLLREIVPMVKARGSAPVTVRVYDHDSDANNAGRAVRIDARTVEGQNVTALIMPLRGNSSAHDWQRPETAEVKEIDVA
jgi:DNA polymerase III sliding clamp (beta) subunit (PCNA family)